MNKINIKGTNCGFNYESGFPEYAHEIFCLLLALSIGFEQRYISITINLDLTIPFCLMLLILLFTIRYTLQQICRVFFAPTLFNGIRRIDF